MSTVSSEFSKSTLNVIGEAALGVELDEVVASCGSELSFLEIYDQIFEQTMLGQVIWMANSHWPIRRFLPFVEANVRFVRAKELLHTMIRRVIRDRVAELSAAHKASAKPGRDLLTFMLEDSQGVVAWSEEDILGHVCRNPAPCLEAVI